MSEQKQTKMIDEMKELMRLEGYRFFSLTRKPFGVTLLQVKDAFYNDKEPRFWSVLKELEIPFGTASDTHADLQTLGLLDNELPEGEYDLVKDSHK